MSEDNGTPRTFYRVCRWDDEYENAQSRPLRFLRWLPAPIRIGTSDYAELLDNPNGLAFYGLWRSITELAAQCQPRGSLLKEGGYPHTQKSIALTLRCSIEILQDSIKVFLHLRWLEELPFTKDSISSLSASQPTAKGTLQTAKENLETSTNNARARRMEGNGKIHSPQPPSVEGGVGRRLTKKERHAEDFAREQEERLKHA